ncbi:Formylglycine-generating enzyme, required for sulfatase activity, contains SUMF1/FGE domain [Nitrosomonas ureae]|uniref:Formylglycine-generating enzyme, required for sulfatase activity, contains SUMF1/FGE domain n=1 Tax=Nitrosomonas ureae TaxID=44577 RepID=A0A285BWI0_9PROT|nr:Formylglycine-generating enzyme, required for sulfatase activity, contains SUMF1/FGE domain [Nitrosomonas ureae]
MLLALAMAGEDRARQNAFAAVLGFLPTPLLTKEIIDSTTNIIDGTNPDLIQPVTTEQIRHQINFRPYHLTSIDAVTSKEAWQQPEPNETNVLDQQDMKAWDASYQTPQAIPIVPWTRLWPKLRQAVAKSRCSTLDVLRLTQQLSHGRVVCRFPRKQRLSWPNPLPVILDFSDRLTPYWHDWHWLQQQLHDQLHQNVHCYRLHGVPQMPVQRMLKNQPHTQFTPWPHLTPGSTMLIVSDLGMTDSAHSWPMTCWQSKLSELKQRGIHVIVLVPASIQHLRSQLTNQTTCLRLSPDSYLRPLRRKAAQDTNQIDFETRLSAAAETLLTMMSVATRIEPALLRELRTFLPIGNRDSGVEGEVWCHPELDTAATACAIAPWAVQRWRGKFRQLPETLQQRTLDCLRNWHAQLPQAIHHEETLLWQHLTKLEILPQEAAHSNKARDFFKKLTNTLQAPEKQGTLSHARMVQLADRHVLWAAPVLKQKESYITRLSVAVHRAEPERSHQGLPAGIDPAEWLKMSHSLSTQRMQLVLDINSALSLLPATSHLPTGIVRLATLEIDRDTLLWANQYHERISTYRPWQWETSSSSEHPTPHLPNPLEIAVESQALQSYPALILHTGQERLHFEAFNPLAWASAWGQDAFGLFAELTIRRITQRFRWITPGTFLMGSPESEPERNDNEAQHEVRLTDGFWLADSACTQALWTAVMEDNPSRFQDDPNLPVENVSWFDIQKFIEKLNTLFPDLHAQLPTEAQWEYACRAGTRTAFSFGESITPGQVNYDGNYPYAGGGKGLYRERTVPVKSLPPNSWGLYEMHGNVWEWCADWYEKYPQQAATNPLGPDQGTVRVLRGGSWLNFGGNARSAVRDWDEPDDRYDNIGFRLAPG